MAADTHPHRRVLTALAETHKVASRRLPTHAPQLARAVKDARYTLARPRKDLKADPPPRRERQRLTLHEATHLNGHLGLAYELKKAFRAAMAVGPTGNLHAFNVYLDLFDLWCRNSKLPPFHTLTTTLHTWRQTTINYTRSGRAPNAFAEAFNHLINNQKRQAHNYAHWQSFRTQIIWAFGKAVHPHTGDITTLPTVPRGERANYVQPQCT